MFTRPLTVAGLLVLLAGCGGPPPPILPTKAESTPDEVVGEVIQAADGNVLQIRPTGSRRDMYIRLIGMDAPRKATRDANGQEPWGTRAQQFLVLKVIRKPVRVEFDVVVPASDDGVTRWGYVWLGEQLLNEEMLRAGHAILETRAPNVKHVDRFTAAQREAREKQRGVWDPDEPLPEPPGKFAAKKHASDEKRQETEDSLALDGWVPGCIIGNSDTKKYHKPGGQYYETSKKSKHAVFFRDAEDAEKAGYKASAK